jgi:bile acid-coenzyme A ligase
VNLATALTELAVADPGRTALTVGDRSVSRGELEAQANRLARAYRDLGVGPGDRVILALPNGVEHFAACHAIWKLGAIPVTTSASLVAGEFAEIVALADPRLVVGRAAAGRRSVPQGFHPGTPVDAGPLPRPPVAAAWRISTSGGSTGRPKLIVAAQSAEIDPRFARRLRLEPDQVQLVCGPLYHSSPFGWATLGLGLGQHLVVLPRFSTSGSIEAIRRHRVSWTCLVPTMMLRIWRAIEAGSPYDFTSLQTVWHMAAPCPPWLKRRWIDLVGAARLLEAYAGTEGLAMTVIDGTGWLAHPGSVGKPASGEIKVMRADQTPASPGQHGEVFMRAMPGTATYRYIGAAASPLADGWESIGDFGYLDSDGYLYLTGRKSDMILVGGANIYPAEIEAAITQHPAVRSCVVVGLPDEDLGHLLHAVVEGNPELSESELRDFLAGMLSPDKHPHSYRIVGYPLRDDAGKVRRSQILQDELLRLGPTTAGTSC